MNRRFTVVVFVVFLLLAAWAYLEWVDVEPVDVGQGTATPTPAPLLELVATDVQEVAVVGATGSYTLTRVAGGWEVGDEQAGDEVDGVVSRLAAPNVTGVVPAGIDPEDYGFAAPTLTVTLKTAAGDTHVLLVGDEVQISPDYYVRLEGEDRIVLLGSSDINQLNDWILDPPLAPTPTPEVTETPEGELGEEGEEAIEEEGEAEAEGEPESGVTVEEVEDEGVGVEETGTDLEPEGTAESPGASEDESAGDAEPAATMEEDADTP